MRRRSTRRDQSRIDALLYATREAPAVWIALLAGGSGCLLADRRRFGPLGAVCAALMVAPGVLFLAFPEARLLPPILCGALLASLRGLSRLDPPSSRKSVRRPMLLSALLLAIFVPAGDSAARDYFAYYRTLDQSLVDAAAAVERQPGDGQVVVRADVRGWPIGWWFEGLTTARIAVGSDARWLAFPDERAAAALASEFFDQRLTGRRARALARRTGVLAARRAGAGDGSAGVAGWPSRSRR